MTNYATAPGNGLCRLCLRDLFRWGHGESLWCDACLLLLRRHPDADPAARRNGRTERVPQEAASIDAHWADGAACAGMPPEMFEYRKLPGVAVPAEVQQAAELLCARCPILDRCRAEADAHEYLGLWGGRWRRYGFKGRYITRDLTGERKAVA